MVRICQDVHEGHDEIEVLGCVRGVRQARFVRETGDVIQLQLQLHQLHQLQHMHHMNVCLAIQSHILSQRI